MDVGCRDLGVKRLQRCKDYTQGKVVSLQKGTPNIDPNILQALFTGTFKEVPLILENPGRCYVQKYWGWLMYMRNKSAVTGCRSPVEPLNALLGGLGRLSK